MKLEVNLISTGATIKGRNAKQPLSLSSRRMLNIPNEQNVVSFKQNQVRQLNITTNQKEHCCMQIVNGRQLNDI